MWTCSKCGEKVEENFDICWSCGTSKEGVEDPDFRRVDESSESPSQDLDETIFPVGMESPVEHDQCRSCGSTKMIRNAKTTHPSETGHLALQVVVDGTPEALLFKDRLYGELRAWVCGECGFTEFWVSNPAELYEKYLKSIKNAP